MSLVFIQINKELWNVSMKRHFELAEPEHIKKQYFHWKIH